MVAPVRIFAFWFDAKAERFGGSSSIVVYCFPSIPVMRVEIFGYKNFSTAICVVHLLCNLLSRYSHE